MPQLLVVMSDHVNGGALCGQHIERSGNQSGRFEQNGIPVKGVILNSIFRAPARIRIMAITNTNISRMRKTTSAVGCDADASYPTYLHADPASKPAP